MSNKSKVVKPINLLFAFYNPRNNFPWGLDLVTVNIYMSLNASKVSVNIFCEF